MCRMLGMKSCLVGVFVLAIILGLGMIHPAFGLMAVVFFLIALR